MFFGIRVQKSKERYTYRKMKKQKKIIAGENSLDRNANSTYDCQTDKNI